VFGRAVELALVGAGCAAQLDGGVSDDDEKEEYSEPEVRNAPAWESHVWEVGEVLADVVERSCQRLRIHLILDRVGILNGFSLYIFLPLS
jgi:hypothetical protein